MADQGPEVRAKLKLDDEASSVLSRIRGGFRETDKQQKSTQKSLSDHYRQLAADLQTFHQGVLPTIRMVTDFGKELLHAAAEGQAFDQALGGLTAVVQDLPIGEATEKAAELADELDLVAIKAGVTGDSVQRGFSALLEITGATAAGVQNARQQIEQMSTVAGVLGKDTEMIAREFAFMGEGILRSRGQLVQLLKQTGIFGDDLKKAAAGWGKLTDEERAKRLAYGLEQLSSKLEGAQPGFNRLVTSINEAWNVAKEKLGEPLIAALIPVLENVVKKLRDAAPAIERFAKMIGPMVGRWVGAAADKMEQTFKWIETHWQEIVDAAKKAADTIKDAVRFILDHKEAIAAAWGLTQLSKLLPGPGKEGTSIGGVPLGAASGIVNVAVQMIAVAALTVLADQISRAMKEGVFESEASKDQAARMEALKFAASRGTLRQQAGYGEARAGAVADLIEGIETLKAMPPGRMPETERAGQIAAYEAQLEEARAPIEALERINESVLSWQEQMNALALQSDQDVTALVSLAMSYSQAAATKNTAEQSYIARLLTQSNELAYSFAESTALTEEGFMGLIETLRVLSPELANELGMIRVMAGMEAGKKPEVTKTNFDFRGSSITIKQDFRDQDPDRIALTFRRDLMRTAETRVRASTGYAFGT